MCFFLLYHSDCMASCWHTDNSHHSDTCNYEEPSYDCRPCRKTSLDIKNQVNKPQHTFSMEIYDNAS